MNKVEERTFIEFEIDGQKLFGVLHLPLNHKGGKVPAVMMYHGLAGNKTGRYRMYVKLAKALSKVGIASFRVDFRGCGDSDGEFSEATVQAFLKDAQVSLQHLVERPEIDSSRIGLFGRSFGAAIALLSAENYPKVKSLALWAPLFNTNQWAEKWRFFNEKDTPQYVRDQMLNIDGQQGSKEFFTEFFALNLERPLQVLKNKPLLHIHGVKDTTIDLHHADLYQQFRNDAPALSKFIRLPEGDHDFAHREDQQLAIKETVEWFKNTLA